jgi:hypothetical protein
MLKSVAIIILAIALGVAAWLLPMRGEQATAQSGPSVFQPSQRVACICAPVSLE